MAHDIAAAHGTCTADTWDAWFLTPGVDEIRGVARTDCSQEVDIVVAYTALNRVGVSTGRYTLEKWALDINYDNFWESEANTRALARTGFERERSGYCWAISGWHAYKDWHYQFAWPPAYLHARGWLGYGTWACAP